MFERCLYETYARNRPALTHKKTIFIWWRVIHVSCLSRPKVCFEMVVTLFYQNKVYLDVKGRVTDGGMVCNVCNIIALISSGRRRLLLVDGEQFKTWTQIKTPRQLPRVWCVSLFISSVFTSWDDEYFIGHMGHSLLEVRQTQFSWQIKALNWFQVCCNLFIANTLVSNCAETKTFSIKSVLTFCSCTTSWMELSTSVAMFSVVW